jgi:hypothetical protein
MRLVWCQPWPICLYWLLLERTASPMQLDVTEGTRWIHWIVFNQDGLYKTESRQLAVAGAPLIRAPPTLLDTVIGQVTTWLGQELLSQL